MSKSIISRIVKVGRKMFGEYLIITNTLSSGLLMAFGDILQQEIEYRTNRLEKRYDWYRLTRMTLVGTLLGPMHHYYYTYLDVVLPKTDYKTISKKIILDQVIASPTCIVFFFYAMGILENKSFAEYHDEFKRKFVHVYVTDCCIWPPSQFINFYYIPSKYRVLYINFITMLYDIFLSYVKHVDQVVKKK